MNTPEEKPKPDESDFARQADQPQSGIVAEFWDFLTGLIRSLVFAWQIIIIASWFGLNASGGAEGVGKATTSAVVVSIFMIIVADSILGLLFYL